MRPSLRRRGARRRQAAADGSMPLIEHIRELRDRLFKATLAIVAGMAVGLFLAGTVQDFLTAPYCGRFGEEACRFNAATPLEPTIVKLKIALYLGLLFSAPVWLYQLWAFVTPGLHKHERRWAYAFVSVATPLFLMGAVLAHFVVAKGIQFLLPESERVEFSTNIAGYIDFVIGMLVIFGVGFEFPLVVLMLNLAGVASARRLLGWWRVAVFLTFVFTAIVTPTPDPFGMTALGIAMSLLYFLAVGAAFLNERRRARAAARSGYAGLSDDEASPLDHEPAPVGDLDPVGPVEPVRASDPVGSGAFDGPDGPDRPGDREGRDPDRPAGR